MSTGPSPWFVFLLNASAGSGVVVAIECVTLNVIPWWPISAFATLLVLTIVAAKADAR